MRVAGENEREICLQLACATVRVSAVLDESKSADLRTGYAARIRAASPEAPRNPSRRASLTQTAQQAQGRPLGSRGINSASRPQRQLPPILQLRGTLRARSASPVCRLPSSTSFASRRASAATFRLSAHCSLMRGPIGIGKAAAAQTPPTSANSLHAQTGLLLTRFRLTPARNHKRLVEEGQTRTRGCGPRGEIARSAM